MTPVVAYKPLPRGPGRRAQVDYGERYRRWEKSTELPMAVIAVAFLGVYAFLVLGNIRRTDVSWPQEFMLGTWMIFALHYLISLILVRNRGHWFLGHLHELAMVILPFLRPLQLLRVVKIVAVLQKTMGSALRGQVSAYVAAVSGTLVLVSALAVLDAEQNAAGANITSFGDAIWWACTTISTVGYGDYYPVTVLGRLVAVGLMTAGIALVGSVTATIASWFVERIVQAQQGAASPGDHQGPRGGSGPQPDPSP